MLARNVVTRRGRRFRGYFPSAKLGRMVAWESLLERDAILLLEFSPGVSSYREQPTVVQYADELRIRDYYPDFELVLGCGSLVHLEVKPSARLADPRVADKLRKIATHYALRRQDFRVVTELEIRREPLLTNLRALAYLQGRPGHVLPASASLRRPFASGPLSYRVAVEQFGRDTLLRLLAAGSLVCDLMLPLRDDTPITLPEGARHAAILL